VQHEDYYQKLRRRFREWARSKEGQTNKWAEYLMWAPDLFHLLCKLSVDRRVPPAEKAKLLAAIAYFVSPVDLVPEVVLGPVGYVDDIAVAALALNGIVNGPRREVVLEHWAGDDDVLDVIQQILEAADSMVGAGLWKRVRGLFRGDEPDEDC